MVSADKLIKVGVKYSDKYFETLKNIYNNAYRNNDSLEDFLNETKDYSIGNPLEAGGFKEQLTNLVVTSTNDIRFSRPAQKALMNTIISNTTGELITNVGDDIKAGVRDIVSRGYSEGKLNHNRVADEINSKLDGINRKRARTIARTEIKRAQVTSNYVVARERGANAYTYKCGAKPCDICEEDCGETFPIDDMEHLPPRHPNCYLPDTEVYTDNGWKYFTDITVDDKILSLNPDDGSIQFLDYVKVIETENVYGYMYHIYNKWFDICVTPDHDCFIHQRRDGGKHGRYMEPQFRKPSELTNESKFVRCIDTDRENPETINVNGLEFTPEDYAFFMAWFISEGSVLHNPDTAKAHGYPVKITQEIGDNREVIQPVLERISDYLDLRLSIGKNGFEFYSKQLHDYLVKLGYSHEKYIPSEVFTLNKECLNIFLDNYVLGDGHERKCSRFNSSERVVFTSSPRLRDDLSYLILLCGYCPSIFIHTEANRKVTHRNGVYITKRPVYGVRINRRQYTNFRSCTVEKIPYTGKVVCVELPVWHTLWVKRNGKTSWNGNCMCGVSFFKDPSLPDVESTSEEDKNNTPISTPLQLKNESVNKRTPMDEDIDDVKEYISELKEEMKNTTNKYDLRDLETELEEAKRELKSYQLEKENFLKQQNSSVEKIQPTTVKFTNDSNINANPNEVRAVYGHKTNHLPESVRENMNQFSKATKSKRNEFSQCYTSSGKISDLMEGTSKKVSETPKITQWKQTVVKHGEEVHLTHNHPVRSDFKLTILSPGDIQSFRSSGFTSYTAEYGGEARVTIGKLPGFKEGKKSEKALSDMIQLTIDIEKGMHLKKYDFSTEEGFERFTNDMNHIAENGGYYYRIEKLNLKNDSSSFPKSNMKDERTDFEKANDRLHELSDKLSIETDPKKFAKLKQEYDELVLKV